MTILPDNDDANHDEPFETELRLAQVPVLGFLMRLTGNLADSHDLLQQTNLTAWEKKDRFEPGSNLVAWMCSIAKNHYLNHVRKAGRDQTVPLFDDDVAHMIEVRHEEREREDARKRRLMHRCIEDLPERHRRAVDAFYLQGKSLEEVAEAEGMNANSVAQLLHRARQNLIKCVRRKGHAELDNDR